MPTALITQSVSLADGRAYTAGTTVDLTAAQLQEAIAGGWAELPEAQPPETPEGARERRSARPERRER